MPKIIEALLEKATVALVLGSLPCWPPISDRSLYMFRLAFALLLALRSLCRLAADEPHPTLALGSPAPDFSLPGTDGNIHHLADFASSKVLAIVFTCNHCPTAQLYEGRIKKLADDYRGKGVSLVAIQPNNPNAIRLDELGIPTSVTASKT